MGKMPRIWLDGKRVKFRAECADCHCIAEKSPPEKGWEYVQLDPYEDTWGWLCPKCQDI